MANTTNDMTNADFAAQRRGKKQGTRTGKTADQGPMTLSADAPRAFTTGTTDEVVIQGVTKDYSHMLVVHKAIGPFGLRTDLTSEDWVLSSAPVLQSYKANKTSGEEALIKGRRDKWVTRGLVNLGLLTENGQYTEGEAFWAAKSRLDALNSSALKSKLESAGEPLPDGQMPKGKGSGSGVNRTQKLNEARNRALALLYDPIIESWKADSLAKKAKGQIPAKKPSPPSVSKQAVWESFRAENDAETVRMEEYLREQEANLLDIAKSKIHAEPYENVGGLSNTPQVAIPDLRGKDGLHVMNHLMGAIISMSRATGPKSQTAAASKF